MKSVKFLIIITVFSLLFSCSPASGKEKQQRSIPQNVFKLTPQQIVHLAKLEDDIISKRVFLPNVINNFIFDKYYYVIGKSDKGNKPERKRASQLDGKRWAAIIMKYILTNEVKFDLKGEYVDFVTFEGEYFDNETGIIYTIYKFRREK